MIVIVLLFAICIFISWAVEQKPSDHAYRQPLRIYSIVYFGLPFLLAFLGQQFLRKIEYQKPTTGILLRCCCPLVKLITVIACIALFPGALIFLTFLITGDIDIRE
jgi:hypothetical protein